MNRFGEIADELTDLVIELEEPRYEADAQALLRALQRAFDQACLAERVVRRRKNGAPEPSQNNLHTAL